MNSSKTRARGNIHAPQMIAFSADRETRWGNAGVIWRGNRGEGAGSFGATGCQNNLEYQMDL